MKFQFVTFKTSKAVRRIYKNTYIKTMRDQGSVGKESPEVKYDRALALFTESVMEPNHQLRGCAHNQGCFDELMEIRKHVLDYLKTMREVTHHTNPDESDEIESAKVMVAKMSKKYITHHDKTMQFMRDTIPNRY